MSLNNFLVCVYGCFVDNGKCNIYIGNLIGEDDVVVVFFVLL